MTEANEKTNVLDDFEARLKAQEANKEYVRSTLVCMLDTFEFMSMKRMIQRAVDYEYGGQHIILTSGEPCIYLDTLEYELHAIWAGVEVTRKWQGVPW